MTDFRKVNTSILPTRTDDHSVSGTARNYAMSPESDRPVMYNTNGFLETSSPHVRGAYMRASNVHSEDDLRKAAQYATSLGGDYFKTTKTIIPPAFGPNISHITVINANDDIALTLSTVTELCKYLREAYPGLYRPGLSWDFWVTNAYTNNLQRTLRIGPPTATGGQVSETVGSTLIAAQNLSNQIEAGRSALVRVLIVSTVRDSEHVQLYFMN